MALKILNGIDVVGSMNITASDVPNLDAAKITSGTLSADRIPDLSAVYLTAGDYLDIDTANATFQPIGDYLISVPSEYLTIGDADGRYQPVGAYQPAGNYFTDGDSVINMNNNDGFVYDDTNNVMYVKLDGTQRALYHTGNFTDNSANWNTAYNWGNHASAGYLTSLPSHNHDTLYDAIGSADAVSSALNERIDTEVFDAIGVVAAEASRGVTAYGWGDHASAGYLSSTGKAADSNLLDGIDSTGFVKQLSDTDTPNYFTPSSRRVDPNTTNPTNEHYAISTFGNGGNVTGQIATHFQTGKLYSRGYNSSWSAWNAYATEAYVNTAVSNLVDSAPGTLNTLNELAAALGDDASFSTTVANNIGAIDTRINEEVIPYIDTVAGDAAKGVAAYGWGNHASAGYLTSLPSHTHNKIVENDAITYGQGSLQWTDVSGLGGTGYAGSTLANPFNDWHHHILMNHANSSGYYVDMAYSFHNDRVHFRRKAGGGDSNLGTWREFWHTGNLSKSEFDSAGSAAAVSTALNERIDTEVFGAIGDVAGTIPTNNNQLTNGSGYITSADGGNADTVDGYQASQLWRRTGATNATVGGGWVTVAHAGQGGRWSGEVIVTDGESGDHSFIRIHWMRSYQDSNFTVLNCGGHANRITGARVLYQTSDTTYGWKYLQVYVTTSSNYYVRITQEGDTPNFSTITAVTPVVENTKSGYAVHGSELTGLENASLAAEEGIKVGGTVYTNSHGDSSQWNTAYGWGNHASAGYLTSIPSDYIRQGTDIVSGNIQPIEDRRQLLGGEENRWKIVFCEILDSAGQHEKNLQNPAGETSVADYATGTVMVWENGKNVPCTTYANHMRMGIAVENVDSPMIQGAEPVLVTGAVAEGDYLVTSTTEGHAVAVSRDTVKQEQLWDCVIGKALESADGESHLIKTWVNI